LQKNCPVERVFKAMLRVRSRSGESVQQMIRRFKKLCEKEGLIRDIKRQGYYEKPSVKNRRRMRKARRNARLSAL
jgi:small subunit ribosomal protein S21